MLTIGGTIKVIDMGLALSSEENTTQLTQAGSMLGTMSYCAPEQVRDASQVDIRADIYALGCTLYHLLAGKSPYSQRKTFPEILKAHLQEPFPSVTAARPDAPPELEAVLARMTTKDPDARLSTPGEVAEALEPFARGAELKRFVSAGIDQSLTVRATTGKVLPTAARRTVTALEPKTKAPWPAIAAVLALLLVIAIAWGVSLAVNRQPANRQTRDSGVPTEADVPTRDRSVIVVVDTSADRGVYDEERKGKGVTNGEEIKNLLGGLPAVITRNEPISINWIDMESRGEARIIRNQPDAVLIHRSALFHPFAAEMGLDYPPFSASEDAVATNNWSVGYRLCDVALASFLANIGSQCLHTKFLVYSRGTDVNWTNQNYRVQWVKNIEEKFPWLKDRISTMWIREGKHGSKPSFQNPETVEDIRNWVRTNAMVRLKAK